MSVSLTYPNKRLSVRIAGYDNNGSPWFDAVLVDNVVVSEAKIRSDSEYVNGVYKDRIIFSGYKALDTNNDTFTDKVQYSPIEVYVVEYHFTHEGIYSVYRESVDDTGDYVPSLAIDSPGSSSEATGGTSPELLAIENEKLALEKERREEEKIQHKNLHSTAKKVITDVMGNEEEITEGYYPALREHKVLEASETQWGLNQFEIEKIDFEGSLLDSPIISDEDVVSFPTFILEEKLSSFVADYLSSVYPDDDFGTIEISPLAFEKFLGR